jgi:hypothetical protein
MRNVFYPANVGGVQAQQFEELSVNNIVRCLVPKKFQCYGCEGSRTDDTDAFQ